MKFTNWIKRFFQPSKKAKVLLEEAKAVQCRIAVEEFAITVAVNLLAGICAKCEIRTFFRGEETKGSEYYALNFSPNPNQTASEFWREFFAKLFLNNEVLTVEIGGNLWIADSFEQMEYAVRENRFVSVTRGDMTFNRKFRASEVLYLRLNRDDIRDELFRLCGVYDELIERAIDKYNRSGGRKGILKVSKMATGTEDQKRIYEDLVNNRFKTYFQAENAVLPLFDGYEYHEQAGEQGKKASGEIGDIRTLVNEAFERVSQGLIMSPAILKGDIADVEKLTDNLFTFSIDPVVRMLGQELTRKRLGEQGFIEKSYIMVDTTCIRHIDIFSIAEKVDKLISNGVYSVNELREKMGDTRINADWADKHWMTLNYNNINNAAASERNGNDEANL